MARQARQGQPQEDLNCQVFSGHLRRLQSPGQKSRQELQALQLGGWPMPVTLVLGKQRQKDQEFRAARWPCLCSTLEHTTFQGHLYSKHTLHRSQSASLHLPREPGGEEPSPLRGSVSSQEGLEREQCLAGVWL